MKDNVKFRLSMTLAELRAIQIQVLHEAEDSDILFNLYEDINALREKYELELQDFKIQEKNKK